METDWLELWRELTSAQRPVSNGELVKKYSARPGKKSDRPDPLLDFVLKIIDGGMTVLDVGAGTGRWTVPLAKAAKKVTAVEPSRGMLEKLHRNIDDAKLGNVQVVPSSWEEADVNPHDITVCAQAMYSSPDLLSFVRKMERCTTRTCYLAVRLPPSDGIIGELSLIIHGRRYDSPNAIIAYNALYSAGIYANILVEDHIHNWTDNTFEEAFARAKRHLNLGASTKYDPQIRDVLSKRLKQTGDCCIWPDGMRSALIWWEPGEKARA